MQQSKYVFEIEEQLNNLYNDLIRDKNEISSSWLDFSALFDLDTPKANIFAKAQFNELLISDFLEYSDTINKISYTPGMIKNDFENSRLYYYQFISDDGFSINIQGYSVNILSVAIRRFQDRVNIFIKIDVPNHVKNFFAVSLLAFLDNEQEIHESVFSIICNNTKEQVSVTGEKYFIYSSNYLENQELGLQKFQNNEVAFGQYKLHTASLISVFDDVFSFMFSLLKLPAYFDFMYDVIDTRKQEYKICTKAKIKKNRISPPKEIVQYRIIKSIRFHKLYDTKGLTEKRSYTLPDHPFTVCGHWRNYKNPEYIGKDQYGKPIAGKIWIKDYSKRKELLADKKLFTENRIVINVKQPIEYGKNFLVTHDPLQTPEDMCPSEEWMYNERRKLTPSYRYRILLRDGFKCSKCGRTAEDNIKLHVDHIIPISKFGLTEDSNLTTLCNECNQGKGNRI